MLAEKIVRDNWAEWAAWDGLRGAHQALSCSGLLDLVRDPRFGKRRMDFSFDFFTVASLIVVAYIALVIWRIGRNNLNQDSQ